MTSAFIEAAKPLARTIAYGMLRGSYASPQEEQQLKHNKNKFDRLKPPAADLDEYLDLIQSAIPEALMAMLAKGHVPDMETVADYYTNNKSTMTLMAGSYAKTVHDTIVDFGKRHSDPVIKERAQKLQDPTENPEWLELAKAHGAYIMGKEDSYASRAKEAFENAEFAKEVSKLAPEQGKRRTPITEKTPAKLRLALLTATKAAAFEVPGAQETLERLYQAIPAVVAKGKEKHWKERVGAQAKSLETDWKHHLEEQAHKAEMDAKSGKGGV